MIDVSSPLAIRRCIPFRLGTLVTFLTRKPIVTHKNVRTLSTFRALPAIDIGGRVFCGASTPPHDNERQGTYNNQHDIYPRNTQRAQQAAILLPSFRSPRLCNYDFIFMDINYTGRLAVSLYGILIQGCRHNGNPRHTDLTAHLPVGEGRDRERRVPAWGTDGEGRCADSGVHGLSRSADSDVCVFPLLLSCHFSFFFFPSATPRSPAISLSCVGPTLFNFPPNPIAKYTTLRMCSGS